MIDPQLVDPENGNYQLAENSPAQGYGCQTFLASSSCTELINDRESLNLRTDSRESLSGIISESIQLTETNISVTGDVFIEDGVILSFAEGSIISFQGNYKIDCQGTISAIGTADNRILFTSQDFYLFENNDNLEGCWNGIDYIHTSDANEESRFEYCIFEYAKAVDTSESLITDSGAVFNVSDFDKLLIENSIFRNNYAHNGAAFALNNNADIVVQNNQFNNNTASISGSVGIVHFSNPKIFNNQLFFNSITNEDDFYEAGLIESFVSKPLFYNNLVYANSDYYFEDNQIFSIKDFHCNHNVMDFVFGNNNTFAEDLVINQENDIFFLEDFSLLANTGTNQLPFDFMLPEYDLLGNPRNHATAVDIGPIEYNSTNIDNSEILPIDKLSCYPNPFNPQTTISFTLSKAMPVSIEIYNIKGQSVTTLVKETLDKGNHSLVWNGVNKKGKRVSSGLYFYKISTPEYTRSSKMIMIK